MSNPIDEWTDAFGKQVAVTTNEADIAGHYPFNPERWRLLVNGSRGFVQYENVDEYTDIVDAHQLTPQASGDVVRLETAEKYRYVVQYVIEWSAAFQVNQALQPGDAIVLGYGDPDLENSTDDHPGPAADGWFLHWHSGLDDKAVRLAEYRSGEAVSETTVDTVKSLQDWVRYAAETNWYNVGETEFVETFTEAEGSDQRNRKLGKVGPPDGKGPEQANQSICASVKAGDGAGSLTLEVGSVGLRTLGQVGPITRQKTHTFNASISTTNTWVPIHAFRIDPDRDLVNTQIADTDIVEFSGSGDVRVIPIAVDPSKVDASGWSTPPELSPTNSIVEVAGSVTTIPDQTGTTGGSASNPGGYQLGFSSWHSSGSGSKTSVSSGSATRKRQLSHGDVCVLIANATASGEVTGEIVTEQDW